MDRLAVERYGLPTLALMENAGAAVARELLAIRRPPRGLPPITRTLVLAGKGNNGGDGLVIARHLHNAGLAVVIVHSHPLAAFSGDAAVMARVTRAMGLAHVRASAAGARRAVDRALGMLPGRGSGGLVVVDALLGVGGDRPLEAGGVLAGLIAAANDLRAGALIAAVDLPSGLDADTGLPLGPEAAPAVRADVTITLAAPKAGFAHTGARRFLGRVRTVDIGVPRALLEAVLGGRTGKGPRRRDGG
jgi:hydroxyethylthiazole kinase-like uncharacterized protein yjeF